MKPVLTLTIAAALLSAAALQPQSPATPPGNAAVREQGRTIFAAKCGKCHDENARKRLSDGSTLLTRLSARKDWQALLGTRLKSMNPENREAVTLYVDSLLSEFQAVEKK